MTIVEKIWRALNESHYYCLDPNYHLPPELLQEPPTQPPCKLFSGFRLHLEENLNSSGATASSTFLNWTGLAHLAFLLLCRARRLPTLSPLTGSCLILQCPPSSSDLPSLVIQLRSHCLRETFLIQSISNSSLVVIISHCFILFL